MILPFGLGIGLAVPIYKQFIDESIKFTHFMLFSGVAFSITAFPVLCRILTELKLLDTTVGIVVLSAGVGNDISELHFQSPEDWRLNHWLQSVGRYLLLVSLL
jgi:Kef-type K+ transport system membrane component KefB